MRAPMVQTIVIAAGGTGGHMVPAASLADALMRSGQRVVLMTDQRFTTVPTGVFADCERHVIEGAGLAGRGPLRIAAGLIQLAKGTRTARKHLSDLNARVVVGFGGYPSVPPILAALALRPRPTLILHDQNAILGGANRLLAQFADHLALSFAQTAAVPRRITTTLTGNPVRPEITALNNSLYQPPRHQIRLLVLGGSLGARIFATLIPAALALLDPALRTRISLTMQCPDSEIPAARSKLTESSIAHELAPFIHDVAPRLAAAHLVIARAGGSTVAELSVIGRPAILIPLAINPDQRHNADALARQGGAIRLDQATTTPEILSRALQTLLTTPDRLTAMAQAAAASGIADATARLANLVLSTMAERVP